MNVIHVQGIDLNLLVVFDAVMAERHATRAAVRLGLTQPAVSHALGRLRTLLADPLFVRVPGGMTPTPLAEAMAPDVHGVLEGARAALNRERGFSPAASDRAFRVGFSDYAALVLLPGLFERMNREAPGASLVVVNTSHGEGLAMLEAGRVELIAGNFPISPPHFSRETLYRERFVCAARPGHPAAAKRMTLRRYLGERHLQVSTRGDPHGYVDEVLDGMGKRRNVRLTVGQFLLASHLLAGSDLVATEPARLFGGGGLVLTLPPFAIPPFAMETVWHSRFAGDAGHAWLRGLLRLAAASFEGKE